MNPPVIDLLAIEDPSYVRGVGHKSYGNGSFALSFENSDWRVAKALQSRWETCMNCGKEKWRYLVHIRNSEDPLKSSALVCSAECAALLRKRLPERPVTRWPHAIRCGLANKIMFDTPLLEDDDDGPAPAAAATLVKGQIDDSLLRRYSKVLSSLEELEQAVLGAKKQLLEKKSQSLLSTHDAELLTWLESFEAWVEDISVCSSSTTGNGNFGAKAQKMLQDLKHVMSKCDQPTSSKLAKIADELQTIDKFASTARVTNGQSAGQKMKVAPPRKRNVISFDGGGIRGVISAVILRALLDMIREKTGNKDAKLDKYFDLAIGTSTGALVAGSIFLLGLSPEELKEYYTRFGAEIFSPKNKVKFNTSDIANYAMVQYHDWPVTMHLMKETKNHRLDESPCRFSGDAHSPIRVVFTSMDISKKPPELVLFRNYETDASFTAGTNEAYLWEALRCSTSATFYFHGYSRRFAPLILNKESNRTEYAQTAAANANQSYRTETRRYSHKMMILDKLDEIEHYDPEKAQRIRSKVENGDALMNSGRVLTDGGTTANNPAGVGLAEGAKLWRFGVTNLISIGTGVNPEEKSEIWNADHTEAPLDLGLLGKKSQLSAMKELLVNSLANTACETTVTESVIQSIRTVHKQYYRINIPLPRAVDMAESNPEIVKMLIDTANEWVRSDSGKSLIESCVSDLIDSRRSPNRHVKY